MARSRRKLAKPLERKQYHHREAKFFCTVNFQHFTGVETVIFPSVACMEKKGNKLKDCEKHEAKLKSPTRAA